jgi:hypothetical protein
VKNVFSAVKNDFSRVENGFSVVENRFCIAENDFYICENGFCTAENGYCTAENGFFAGKKERLACVGDGNIRTNGVPVGSLRRKPARTAQRAVPTRNSIKLRPAQ